MPREDDDGTEGWESAA
jgi:hypothetical protein